MIEPRQCRPIATFAKSDFGSSLSYCLSLRFKGHVTSVSAILFLRQLRRYNNTNALSIYFDILPFNSGLRCSIVVIVTAGEFAYLDHP